MTTRYQVRVRGGTGEPVSSRSKGDARFGLFPELPALPSLVHDAGYATALMG